MPAPTKIIIDNVEKVNLSFSYDVKENETKRKVSLSLELEDEQAMEIIKAQRLYATWSVQFTILSKQLPMTDKPEA